VSKTLRIVAKDIRHLWPEVLLTLVFTAGFAATEHFGWQADPTGRLREAQILSVWMNALMPLSWWLLIARAVHDESLVGDRQFWITRPYSWQRVLGAKIILLSAFILIPFLLAQCFILHQAGLHPLAVLPGLLLKLVLLFAFVLLPLLALSTVTSSLTRMLLIFFAVILYALLAMYLTSVAASFFPIPAQWTPMPERRVWWDLLLFIPVITAAVTLLQYARRRTRVSSWLLVGLVALLTFTALGDIYAKNQRSTAYPTPLSNEVPPLRVVFNTDPAYQLTRKGDPISASHSTDSFALSVPINVTDIAPGHAVQIDGKSISYKADEQGVSGTDTWQHNGEEPFVSNTPFRQEIDLPRSVYRVTAGKSITFHLSYAVTEYEAEPAPFTVPFTGAPIDVPQHGRCVQDSLDNEVRCQYALKGPQFTLITWHLHQTCGASLSADRTAERWIGGERANEAGFSPIVSINNILNVDPLGRRMDDVEFCPGEPLTFTRYRFVRRRLIEVTLPPIDPQHYVLISRD
jgi:hypothetical protein